MNNETTTKTFSQLTIADVTTLAASDNLDDMHLAHRISKRIELEVLVARGRDLSAQQAADLVALVEIIDGELTRISI
jgi:hypothetical protein